MKQLLTILTLSLIMLYSMSVPVLWGLYYLRADAVAAAFCENPDKPSCHGKCHMAKIASKHQTDSDAPPVLEVNPEKPLLFVLDQLQDDTLQKEDSHRYSPQAEPPALRRGYPSGIFHPPLLLA